MFINATDENISLAAGVKIHAKAIVRAFDGGNIHIGKFSVIQNSAIIEAKSGKLKIRDNVEIGRGCVIISHEQICIGEGSLIAEYVTIRDQDHIFPSADIRRSGLVTGKVSIGDNVWIGAKVTITKGVDIGDNCVIAAGAVVIGDIPSNCLAGGVPAKIIRSWDRI